MFDNESFDYILKQKCNERNITTSDLERHFGWSQGLISRWKTNSPSIDKVISIAKYLEISVSALLGETEDKPPPDSNSLKILLQATKQGVIIWKELNNDSLFGRDAMKIIYQTKEFASHMAYYCGNDEISYVLSIQWGNKDHLSDENVRFKFIPILYNNHPDSVIEDNSSIMELLKYVDKNTYSTSLSLKKDELESKFINSLS